ncbi:MAG: FAD-binding protein [Synergistaceae bacterium]|jgi:fumarate reductase (CoM/CoB) subunit A|nr:FAD-binding protein [Synergistaceae bacterium]
MERIDCDVLIVGGAAAGIRAALEVSAVRPDLYVLMVADSRCEVGGSTNMVASEALGINAPFDYEHDGDTVEIFENDMIQTGGGLAEPKLCGLIARESADRVLELMDMGLVFHSSNGRPHQKKLSGCTKARSLTCGGDTGREIVRVLKMAAIQNGVKILENIKIISLFTDENGAVSGAYGIILQQSRVVFISTCAVVLATGGSPGMFRLNVSSPTQTGDGWAMAYGVGCKFVNMEFFQCGPAVAKQGLKFIIHSHIWSFKPRLTNSNGIDFLESYCGSKALAAKALELKAMSYPFSVRTDSKYVDIAIFKEIEEGRATPNGGVWFDVTHIPKEKLRQRVPITYDTLLGCGIDLAVHPIELQIAVQNFNGGILIDEDGFTGIEGLYAAGEVSGGVHGADRPGGNNLTDTQVFGYRAGQAAALRTRFGNKNTRAKDMDIASMLASEDELKIIKESEKIYFRYMTIIRNKAGIQKVFDFIDEHDKKAVSVQLKNRLTVGRILAQAILIREESRGTHYREDYPDNDDRWCRRIVLSKGSDGFPIESS